jgi:hypothetical protein
MEPLKAAAANAKLVQKDSVDNEAVFLDKPKSSAGKTDRPEVEELPSIFSGKDFSSAATNAQLTETQVSALMAKVQAQYPGALISRFKSRFGLSDRSILFEIPGPQVDRYIHTIWDSSGLSPTIFLIGVEKVDATGKKLSPPRTFFSSFTNQPISADSSSPADTASSTTPTPNTATQYTATSNNPHMQMAKAPLGITIKPGSPPVRMSTPQVTCFVCHRTGAMPIVPDDGIAPISYTSGKSGTEVIRAFNQQIRNTATATPPSINSKSLGPMIGAIDPPTRTDDFVKSCFTKPGFTQTSVNKVKQAMNCAECHDGQSVGRLTFPLGMDASPNTEDEDLFNPGDVLNQMLAAKHMPPGANLSDDESVALAVCIGKEYYGGFQGLVPNSAPGTFMNSLTSAKCPSTFPGQEATFTGVSKPGQPATTSQNSTGTDQNSAPAK